MSFVSSLPQNLVTPLAALGALSATVLLYRTLRFIQFHTRSPSLHRYINSDGSWALVTGASDGIGLRFAEELARAGFDVLLHGRNPTKLESVKKSIQAQFPDRRFRVVVADAAALDGMRDVVKNLAGAVKSAAGGSHVAVVIHNVGGVGMLSRRLLSVEESTLEELDMAMNANARFSVLLTRELMPLMSKGATGLIMYISSFAGVSGAPYVTSYAGSKAFLMAWAVALAREVQMQGKDIEVKCAIAGRVSNASYYKDEPATLFRPSATALARAALAKVGSAEIVFAPHWAHALQGVALGWLSEWMASILLKHEVKQELLYQVKVS